MEFCLRCKTIRQRRVVCLQLLEIPVRYLLRRRVVCLQLLEILVQCPLRRRVVCPVPPGTLKGVWVRVQVREVRRVLPIQRGRFPLQRGHRHLRRGTGACAGVWFSSGSLAPRSFFMSAETTLKRRKKIIAIISGSSSVSRSIIQNRLLRVSGQLHAHHNVSNGSGKGFPSYDSLAVGAASLPRFRRFCPLLKSMQGQAFFCVYLRLSADYFFNYSLLLLRFHQRCLRAFACRLRCCACDSSP